MTKLGGKVAVVTGASKGIGAAIAQELANDGAAVIVNYAYSPQQANELVQKLKSSGGNANAVRADVTKPAEAKHLVGFKFATHPFFLDEAEHFLQNRSASVATLRRCSGSSRNAVRLPIGTSVRLPPESSSHR